MEASNRKIVDQDEVTAVSVDKSLLSVDYASKPTQHSERLGLTLVTENIEISDYLQEGDVGFKKPKVGLVQLPVTTCSSYVTFFRRRNVITISVSSNPPWVMPRSQQTATKRCR